jgi:hypothetical protein
MKNTSFMDERIEIIFNVLMIFQICVKFLNEGAFSKKIP